MSQSLEIAWKNDETFERFVEKLFNLFNRCRISTGGQLKLIDQYCRLLYCEITS